MYGTATIYSRHKGRQDGLGKHEVYMNVWLVVVIPFVVVKMVVTTRIYTKKDNTFHSKHPMNYGAMGVLGDSKT